MDSKNGADVEELVENVLSSYEAGPRSMHHIGAYELPQQAEVQGCIETVRALLLPGFVGASLVNGSSGDVRAYVRERLDDLKTRLRRQVYRGIHHRCRLGQPDRAVECAECAAASDGITSRFLAAIPELRTALATDTEAAYEGDPAATGTDEVIFCYPGLY